MGQLLIVSDMRWWRQCSGLFTFLKSSTFALASNSTIVWCSLQKPNFLACLRNASKCSCSCLVSCPLQAGSAFVIRDNIKPQKPRIKYSQPLEHIQHYDYNMKLTSLALYVFFFSFLLRPSSDICSTDDGEIFFSI